MLDKKNMEENESMVVSTKEKKSTKHWGMLTAVPTIMIAFPEVFFISKVISSFVALRPPPDFVDL